MFKLEEVLNVLNEDVYHKLESDYSLQGHISEKRGFDLKSINPSNLIKTPDRPYKGFWTSTVYKDVDKFVSKWMKFDRSLSPVGSSMHYDDDNIYFHLYTIKNGPNIKHIGSSEEAHEFVRSYREGFEIGHGEIVWGRVAKDYDAVHVYDEGFNHDVFIPWDVESTVWFDPKLYLKEQFVWKLGEKDE